MKNKFSENLKFSPALLARNCELRYPLYKVIAFYTVLFAGFIAGMFLIPWRPVKSESENRMLQEFPAFSFDKVLNGSYTRDITLWFSDTFPLRERMVEMNGRLQGLYGLNPVEVHGDIGTGDDIPDPARPTPSAPAKTTEATGTTISETTATTQQQTTATEPQQTTAANEEPIEVGTIGAVLVAGDAAYEYYNFNRSTADKYIETVNAAAAKLAGTAQVYSVIAPLSIDITLRDDLRAKVTSSDDQQKALNYIFGSMSEQVRTANPYDTLRAHRDEYLYFRTDHHWTARGAYYAYAEFCKQKGTFAPDLSMYETIEFPGFLGSFYSNTGKNPKLGDNPDTVVAYLPLAETDFVFTDTNGSKTDWMVIQDVSNWNASSKYNCFIAGDQPYSLITNKEKTDGSACVIVKESFGNAFAPFLITHYQYVHIVDYRYFKSNLISFVTDNGITDVLFVNNVSATRNAGLIDKLSLLVN
ncbi:MAG: DHHW family protein [Oscillospiraceae bacterium]|nr:DHHW family protein [Oscillospiraceae bacterium]